MNKNAKFNFEIIQSKGMSNLTADNVDFNRKYFLLITFR